MTKVVFVQAFFKEVTSKATLVHVPTGRMKKNWLGYDVPETKDHLQTKPSGRYSKTHVDGVRLAQDVASVANTLEQEGFDVIATESVLSGHHDHRYSGNGGYGYGYSVTQGILLIARKKAE